MHIVYTRLDQTRRLVTKNNMELYSGFIFEL